MPTRHVPLQFGNHKLPRTTGIFNLPRSITCPGQTDYCLQHCYARKAELQYPKNVVPYRMQQLKTAQDPAFVSFIKQYITKRKVAGSPLSVIRIHESGDFYNQAYLDKWIQIAKDLPQVTFYAYTKSLMFDFSKRPKNMIIRGSVDITSRIGYWMKAMELDGTAETIEKNAQPLVEDAFKCPGSCKTCDYCLKPGNVYFYRH